MAISIKRARNVGKCEKSLGTGFASSAISKKNRMLGDDLWVETRSTREKACQDSAKNAESADPQNFWEDPLLTQSLHRSAHPKGGAERNACGKTTDWIRIASLDSAAPETANKMGKVQPLCART
jgi:hypothetical protein